MQNKRSNYQKLYISRSYQQKCLKMFHDCFRSLNWTKVVENTFDLFSSMFQISFVVQLKTNSQAKLDWSMHMYFWHFISHMGCSHRSEILIYLAVCLISIKNHVHHHHDNVQFPACKTPVNTPGTHGKNDFHIGCEGAELRELKLGFTLLGSQSFGE